jgi:hypothetical protein
MFKSVENLEINMLNGTTISKKFAKTASGAVCLASALAFLVAPGISSAGSFTFDGINTAGDMYTESFSAPWFNGHGTDKSNYKPGGGQMTTVLYGTGTDNAESSGPTYSWLFLEVPLYAKTMVWGAGQSLDFGKATGSEKVVFGTSPGTNPLTVAKIDDKKVGKSVKKVGKSVKKVGKSGKKSGKKAGKSSKNGSVFGAATELDLDGGWKSDDGLPWKVVDFMDSVDYLLGAGSAECASSDPAKNCAASGRTMSFEVKLELLNGGYAALKKAIMDNGLGFHLSPEEFGDPPSVVPVPAAFWLFGTALIGFIGFSRKTSPG